MIHVCKVQEFSSNYPLITLDVSLYFITTKVKSALLADKTIASREISVETFKGRVQLSGFVTSTADANRAVEVTRGVAGVRSIENDMRLK